MAEAGVGVDIVQISRMERIRQVTPGFFARVFTAEEVEFCETSSRPMAQYACRFAAREAVLKALGTGFKGIGRKDVSVTAGQNGRPTVLLAGRAKELAEERGIVEFALSLSATGNLAIANAMALTEETRPKAKQTAQDEKQRIAQSFREARSVLDELERVQSGDEALENEER